jgi:hypothetical protein
VWARLRRGLDFNGKRVLYATAPPGGDFGIRTYLSHPWVSTDTAGRRVSAFLPDARAAASG